MTAKAIPSVEGIDRTTRAVLNLIASRGTISRTEIARKLDIAASTVSLRVAELQRLGLVKDSGDGASTGGRRPKLLSMTSGHGVVASVELGGAHARIGLADFTGRLLDTASVALDITEGPERTCATVAEELRRLVAAGPDACDLRGVGVALPGPVSPTTGAVDSPSRMPGWQGFRVGNWLEEELRVRVVVDNDANLMALGEHHAQLSPDQHSITVKVGTAIGSGIIVGGSLYRGATNEAGDITHTRVAAAGDTPCSCGNTGCLETIASGAGVVRRLRADGMDVDTTADVLSLVRDADRHATTMVRSAGGYLGDVLASVINFFNPTALFLAGGMATCEPFVAAVRGRIYEGCHPLATRELRIETASTGADAALIGATRLTLERLMHTESLIV